MLYNNAHLHLGLFYFFIPFYSRNQYFTVQKYDFSRSARKTEYMHVISSKNELLYPHHVGFQNEVLFHEYITFTRLKLPELRRSPCLVIEYARSTLFECKLHKDVCLYRRD